MGNAVLLINLLLGLLDRAGAISSLLKVAHAEGRDITEAELDELVAGDDVARKELDAAIKAAKGAAP